MAVLEAEYFNKFKNCVDVEDALAILYRHQNFTSSLKLALQKKTKTAKRI